MICISGGRECDGCMQCYQEDTNEDDLYWMSKCSCCGNYFDPAEMMDTDDGEVCTDCFLQQIGGLNEI